jgi:N-acetylglucosamine-6-phosphate deacetylase
MTPNRSGYASSTIRMIDAVACRLIGALLPDAVRMATLTPARLLGVDQT